MTNDMLRVASDPKGSYTTFIGNEAEVDVMNILRSFPEIDSCWKDGFNSKFDIYYILKGEHVLRGLQVKSITKDNSNKDIYRMNHCDKYKNGTLMVGINKNIERGCAYLATDQNRIATIAFDLSMKHSYEHRALFLTWDNFLATLKDMLSLATIITQEIFENSMYKDALKEYLSTVRFFQFCEKYGLKYEKVSDTSSRTDVIVEGLKVQLKFASLPQTNNAKTQRVNNRTYSYKVLADKIYHQGDNNVYVIELGTHSGDFLILSEGLMIRKKMIKTDDQRGRTNLDVYPYNYIERKKGELLLRKTTGHIPKVTGNWTCTKELWFSTEKGQLGAKTSKTVREVFLNIEEEQEGIFLVKDGYL
jgi:hypothetical protein